MYAARSAGSVIMPHPMQFSLLGISIISLNYEKEAIHLLFLTLYRINQHFCKSISTLLKYCFNSFKIPEAIFLFTRLTPLFSDNLLGYYNNQMIFKWGNFTFPKYHIFFYGRQEVT